MTIFTASATGSWREQGSRNTRQLAASAPPGHLRRVEKPIRILVLNGSIRPGNYTAMASALVIDELRKHPKVDVDVITLGELKLDPPGINPNSPDANRLQDAVKGATAIVIATPEYHGSFSSLVKLAIENLGFP